MGHLAGGSKSYYTPVMSGDPLAGIDEGEALRRWREDGDVEALDQILRVEISHLKVRLRAQGYDRGSMGASDYVDEVVMKMLRQDPAPELDSAGAMRAYLWRAARNLLIDRLRKHRGDTVYLDASNSSGLNQILAASSTGDPLESQERVQALELGLNLLSDTDRELLERTYVKGESAPELAEAMDIQPEAVRMRLVRARRRLGKLLSDWQNIID